MHSRLSGELERGHIGLGSFIELQQSTVSQGSLYSSRGSEYLIVSPHVVCFSFSRRLAAVACVIARWDIFRIRDTLHRAFFFFI